MNKNLGIIGGLVFNATYVLEGFQFRWLSINGIDAAFPISITLFSNQSKMNVVLDWTSDH